MPQVKVQEKQVAPLLEQLNAYFLKHYSTRFGKCHQLQMLKSHFRFNMYWFYIGLTSNLAKRIAKTKIYPQHQFDFPKDLNKLLRSLGAIKVALKVNLTESTCVKTASTIGEGIRN